MQAVYQPYNFEESQTMNDCAQFGEANRDPMYASLENVAYHVTCLKCCVCKVVLCDENSCYKKNGNIYCRNDFIRNFGSCATCRVVIQPGEPVMRIRDLVYHAGGQCFCCSKCKRPLVSGENYVALSKSIECFDCYRVDSSIDASSLRSGSPNKQGQPRRRMQTSLPSLGNDKLNNVHKQRQKSKRIRTSFTYNQLCVMKAYFASNHNPDAKDIKQLSQKTKLNTYVIQIWFQNARAKFRRSCQKSKTDTELCMESKTSDLDISPSCDGGSETGSDNSKTVLHKVEADKYQRSCQKSKTDTELCMESKTSDLDISPSCDGGSETGSDKSKTVLHKVEADKYRRSCQKSKTDTELCMESKTSDLDISPSCDGGSETGSDKSKTVLHKVEADKYRRSCQKSKTDTELCMESKTSDSDISPSCDGGSETGSDNSKTVLHKVEADKYQKSCQKSISIPNSDTELCLEPRTSNSDTSPLCDGGSPSSENEAISSCSASGFDCSFSASPFFDVLHDVINENLELISSN